MGVRLLRMEIRNFQGCKHLVLEPNGKNLNIFGQNETGKTTVASAWTWLLFDKNVQNQSTQKFDIKPLNENNEPIHGLETLVKADLDVDSCQLALEKKYYEVWEKKRGSSEEIFSGHTTDHYISGVPVKKSEFDQEIKNLADEKIFRLLTDPFYFNTQLHWKERRDILLQVCGGISGAEVIESNDDLVELFDILAGRSVEKHKAVLKRQMNAIEEDIKKIPIRIDEVNRGLPDITDINADNLQADIKVMKEKKKEKEQELSRIENGGEIAQKNKRLTEIETELQQIINKYSEEYLESITNAKANYSNIKGQVDGIERQIKTKKEDIKTNNYTINRHYEFNKKQLKDNWYELQEKKKALMGQEYEGDTICPSCGQLLPEEQVEEARKNFNLNKAVKLEELTKEQDGVTEKGKGLNGKIELLKKQNRDIENEIEKHEAEKKKLQELVVELRSEIDELNEKAKASHYQENFKYKKKSLEKQAIEQSIGELKHNNVKVISEVCQEIAKIEDEITFLEKEFKKLDDHEKGQKRAEELKVEEREFSNKHEELQRQMYLCEQFEKTRAELLENKVNGRFKLANFKLFEKQINGGISPTCRTIYKGVPYNTNLNDGHRVKVGIDIINTLSAHYNFWAPIFADRMESVTGDIETGTQLIKLIVSKNDKKLRVEVEEKGKMKEAV